MHLLQKIQLKYLHAFQEGLNQRRNSRKILLTNKAFEKVFETDEQIIKEMILPSHKRRRSNGILYCFRLSH